MQVNTKLPWKIKSTDIAVFMCTLGMLEMAMWRGSRLIRIVKLALKAGSSKQGKAPRAKVASNCVDARTLIMKIDNSKIKVMSCLT